MNEVWVRIEKYPRYCISNKGSIKKISLNRVMPSKTDTFGTHYIYLEHRDGGRSKREYVHELVAEAFLDGPRDNFEVKHVNGNKDDNSVKNLIRVPVKPRNRIVPEPDEPTVHSPYRIKVMDVDTGEVYASLTQCATATGVSRTSIRKSIEKCISVKGYTFEYV